MIAAVILAAGAATRMGRPKQLLPLAGRPLVRHVADLTLTASLDEVIVVTGAAGADVTEAVADLPVRTVHNPGWLSGQAGSLQAGLAAVSPGAEAVLFLLADQPLVAVDLVDSLIEAYRQGKGSIIVPVADGRRGNPVLFDLARWRDELMALTGDAGARGLIAAHPGEVATVEAPADAFFDIDTPADYDKLLVLWQNRTNDGGDPACG